MQNSGSFWCWSFLSSSIWWHIKVEIFEAEWSTSCILVRISHHMVLSFIYLFFGVGGTNLWHSYYNLNKIGFRFSVAWYPIYRIPEGKFGAAFLTYHSLGHMVMRDVPTDTLKKKTHCVVSPVVGLLSYKAQIKFKL